MDIVLNILLALGILSALGIVAGAVCALAAIKLGAGKEDADKVKAETEEAVCAEDKENARTVAFVKCRGNEAEFKYTYAGERDCFSANLLAGGAKACGYSCLGLGSCAAVCPNGAISVENGVAFVNEEKCDGCGRCAAACPRGVIALVPQNSADKVACSNCELGSKTRKNCEVGCIGCLACAKNCKYDAVIIADNLATIDYSKCVGCGECAAACPRGIITAPPVPEVEEEFDESEYFSLQVDGAEGEEKEEIASEE